MIVLLALTMGGAARAAPTTDETQIVQNEQALADAYVNKDAAKVSELVAEEAWFGDSSGFWGRKLLLRVLSKGVLNIKSEKIHDLQVRVRGDTALVRGMDDEVTVDEGKDVSGTYGWIDTWAHRDGKWVLIASQYTKLERKN